MTAEIAFTCRFGWDKDNFAADPAAAGMWDLGIVDNYKSQKNQQMDSFEYPDTDARDQEYFDISGSEKVIQLGGTYVPSDQSWATLLAWKERMEACVNGYIFDSSINLFLALYIKDYYEAGHHLWIDRWEAPLLELSPSGQTGINNDTEYYNYPRPEQDSASNQPLCVTLRSFNISLKAGESPTAVWEAEMVTRYEIPEDE